jgi:hypothetical protein
MSVFSLQRIFTTRDHQQGMSQSHFVNYPGFSDPPGRLPTPSELLSHDESRSSENITLNSLQWSTVMVYIWEMPGSNCSLEVCYRDWFFVVVFAQTRGTHILGD